MNEKITQQQLTQIVAEVASLSQRQETELDRQQVQDILKQLNLSPELLDEAMTQLKRKKALAEETKRNNRIKIALITSLFIGISWTVGMFYLHGQKLDQINVYQSRLSLTQDTGENLNVIDRQNPSEIYYQVTLEQAPVGETLNLRCDWVDPNGNIAHQNNYTTRTITTSVWPTHCRYQFNQNSLPGTWQVQIYLGDRLLSQNSFTVK